MNVLATYPPSGFGESSGSRDDGAWLVQDHVLGDKRLAAAGRVHRADDPPAGQQRHGVVAAIALVLRHVRLERVLVAEHPQRALAVPDQRVEGGQQSDAVRAAAARVEPAERPWV